MVEAFRTISLDKDVPIPLYYQLKKQLLTLIGDGSLKNGDMLPPENELCEMLGVSRPTIRQALGEMVAEGYLHRYKGRGTFVSTPKVEERFLSKLESFNREMLQKGMTPSTQVMALEKLEGPDEANERLQLPLNAPLICLSRLRCADDTPLVCVDTYLSCERFPLLLEVDFTQASLYTTLEELYDVRVDRVLREIEATNAVRKDAELLGVARGKAICLVKTVSYAGDSPLPVEFSIARYRGDRNKFSVEIRR